ncbi:14321_t:CDS:2 [Gigaspora margarita]|uniref:14321_t:CDS:1 n=1 Tax=Gigaspora margarita TaxID=4874 RepID=A0ABM8W251_GIGMA|nr:14321_t:CDS:2 [Gigaspora margarita]
MSRRNEISFGIDEPVLRMLQPSRLAHPCTHAFSIYISKVNIRVDQPITKDYH